MKTLIKNGTIVTATDQYRGDVLIDEHPPSISARIGRTSLRRKRVMMLRAAWMRGYLGRPIAESYSARKRSVSCPRVLPEP